MKLVICVVYIALSIASGMEPGDTTSCTQNCNNMLNPVCATSKSNEIVVFANSCARDYNKCLTPEKEYLQLDPEVCKEHLKQNNQDLYRNCRLHLEGWDRSEKGEFTCEVDIKEKTILATTPV